MKQDISKIYLKSKSKNYIVTIAIGKKYLSQWKNFAFNNWKQYCVKNDIGIMVIQDDIIDKNHPKWKKATWQKMLIGNYIKENKININNVCYLDTDYLINLNSPNIFHKNIKNKISVVSAIKNIPYPLDYIRRKIAFNRKIYFDKKYPLDSALFINEADYYKFHNVTNQKDIINMGFFLFNVNYFYKKMKKWFFKYNANISGLTNGGDNPYMSYEILNNKKTNLLNYKFNTLWNYEMAFKYSFLYKNMNNKNLIKVCVEDSLNDCYFLHFAGSWLESNLWLNKNLYNSKINKINNKIFLEYCKKKISGLPAGRVVPKK